MLDIGIGELFLVAVVALLVFGPDRLPRAAADAVRTLRHVRGVIGAARRDLISAAGLESDGELAGLADEIRAVDPRRSPPPKRPAAGSPSTGSPAQGQDRPAPSPGDGAAGGVRGADPDWT